MTVKMYADRKKWELDEVEVELTQNRIYHSDCEDCESNEGYVHSISKKIVFRGNLTNKQKQRLLEIAKKCPVHKTLTNEIQIN